MGLLRDSGIKEFRDFGNFMGFKDILRDFKEFEGILRDSKGFKWF